MHVNMPFWMREPVVAVRMVPQKAYESDAIVFVCVWSNRNSSISSWLQHRRAAAVVVTRVLLAWDEELKRSCVVAARA
jgi:hypothetical protein